MYHLSPLFIKTNSGNDLAPDCGCSTSLNQDNPFFLVKGSHSLQQEDPHSPPASPLQQPHSLKHVDVHHFHHKVSLRREKDKTSLKHSEVLKSTRHLHHLKNPLENRKEWTPKVSHKGQERKNHENVSLCHSCSALLTTVEEKHIQHFSPFQQKEASIQTSVQTQKWLIHPQTLHTHHLDIHPMVHFSFQSPRPSFSRCNSEKVFTPLVTPCPSSRNNHQENSDIQTVSSLSAKASIQQENQEDRNEVFEKKKLLGTKLSNETNCSQSYKEKLHFVSEEILELMGSRIDNKQGRPKREKTHRRLRNMSDLCEVKSVADSSQQQSDNESIVLGKLMESDGQGLFAQFEEPKNDFMAKRRFTLKNH